MGCVNNMPLGLVVLLVLVGSAAAQVTITVTTIGPETTDGSPNTFLGTGNQIASSLLGSGVPAMIWGVVPSSDVNAVCTNIVNTGSLSFSANIVASGYPDETRTLTVTNIGGCLAASDGSGTQAVMVDDTTRKSALVCPDNAGTTGCGVYFTGDDVTALYNEGSRRRLLASRKLLQTCQSGAAAGAVSGALTGVMDIGSCLRLGLFAPLCAAGVVGANAAVGAAEGCASSCFPGDAVVTLASGETKTMAVLAVGDKVAVKGIEGAVAYEDVYAFGHKDVAAEATYLRLTLANAMAAQNRTLELTSLHFAPVMSSGSNMVYKRAGDIEIGDRMWAQDDDEDENEAISGMYVVKRIDTVVKQGLYNPFTLGGTIIVNGVVASSHSDWFLDGVFQAMGLTHRLPAAYQLILLPVRMLYTAVGKDVYIRMYQRLDSLVDIAQFGTKHGAQFAVSLATVSAGAMTVALLSLPKGFVTTSSLSNAFSHPK